VKTSNGGWTKKQLRLFGVEWPPQPGWRDRICVAQMFIFDADLRSLKRMAKAKPIKVGNRTAEDLRRMGLNPRAFGKR
jgi:hypothetical protein